MEVISSTHYLIKPWEYIVGIHWIGAWVEPRYSYVNVVKSQMGIEPWQYSP
jgi:hypothetical protein